MACLGFLTFSELLPDSSSPCLNSCITAATFRLTICLDLGSDPEEGAFLLGFFLVVAVGICLSNFARAPKEKARLRKLISSNGHWFNSSRVAYFLELLFLATADFLATAFFAGVLAATFLAATFLAGAVFLAAALAVVFFAAGDLDPTAEACFEPFVATFLAATVFLLVVAIICTRYFYSDSPC